MNDDHNAHVIAYIRNLVEEDMKLWWIEANKMLRGLSYDRNILEPDKIRQESKDTWLDSKNEEQW